MLSLRLSSPGDGTGPQGQEGTNESETFKQEDRKFLAMVFNNGRKKRWRETLV